MPDRFITEADLLRFPADIPIHDPSFLDSIPTSGSTFGEWTQHDTESIKVSVFLGLIGLCGWAINYLLSW
jgi:hypothetical protein